MGYVGILLSYTQSHVLSTKGGLYVEECAEQTRADEDQPEVEADAEHPEEQEDALEL